MAKPKTLYKIDPLISTGTIHVYLTRFVPESILPAIAKIEGVYRVNVFKTCPLLSVDCNPNYDVKEIAQEIDQVIISHLYSAFHEFVGNLAGLETL